MTTLEGVSGGFEYQGPFLEVRGLQKVFSRRGRGTVTTLEVLKDIDVSAQRGEFVTVIGPSGCGKTTLLNCVAGLVGFDSGTITVGGKEVHGPGADRAVVFQQASLYPWRTVKRNVTYGLELRRQLTWNEISERADRAVELVGLSGFASHYPHELSGGMQQRTNLARALAVDPSLLLMDEPFGALDALTKEILQDELSRIAGQSQQTILFITHDIGEAVFLGDAVYVMKGSPGRVDAKITVPFDRPRKREIAQTPEFERIVADLRHLLRGNEQRVRDKVGPILD